jgi:hypothetical protein
MLKGKQDKTHYLALFGSAYSDICFGGEISESGLNYSLKNHLHFYRFSLH